MKVVINRCFGGFSVSAAAMERINQLGCQHKEETPHGFGHDDHDRRACPVLVKVVEELGDAANGAVAALKIVEIPDDVEWEIDEYDGIETIHEKHRSWS